jgi:ubiquinone/menaquinone biosynthesis C-methylase UbiE
MAEIFDELTERYDQWFETPIGRLIKRYESDLILELLSPLRGEKILDAGCGSGVFTLDILDKGTNIVGLELSLPMLMVAIKKTEEYSFLGIQSDMTNLPFMDNAFDKVVSVTAIEFIKDARGVISEFFRVTKPGGRIVVATLNSLSSWADRRRKAGEKGHPIFRHAFFRSPKEIRELSPIECTLKTAIHFQKNENPGHAIKIEKKSQSRCLSTGAFIAAQWLKPAN